jgi:hypothetical protein
MPSYSNGTIYADLDNDGDLDIVVNNIDDPVLLYENRSNENNDKAFAEIHLKGPAKNVNAIGSKLFVFVNGSIRVYENNPVKGFQSSMLVPLHIGLDKSKVDSALLVWPDNSYQQIHININKIDSIIFKTNLPKFDYSIITALYKNKSLQAEDITGTVNLFYKHTENPFAEFNREPLIPHMLSTEGPALAIADINKDGLDDVFVGSSKTFHNAIFLQRAGGKFEKMEQPGMIADSMHEDVDAVWADVNNDTYPDLVIASGGNEYYGKDRYMLPRVYINDKTGRFAKLNDAFTNVYMTASCVVTSDFNGDGYADLFIGGRSVPWTYGEIPQSYLLQNDGTGRFVDVTLKIAKELSNVGFVTGSKWVDIDNDNDNDLIVCCEWGGIYAFINNKGLFEKKVLTDKKGWWNFVLPVDIDGDGDFDLIAGNLGLNNNLKASDHEPVKMYVNDFDENGKKEQLVTYFVNGREVPFANKEDLLKQIPTLKKKFLYAEDFAKASLEKIVGQQKLSKATKFEANYFSNAVLINQGGFNFTIKELPWEAQLSSYRDAAIIDGNGDIFPDILLTGNYYDNTIQMGRYDADFGTILINKGNQLFECEDINGEILKGQIRKMKPIVIEKRQSYILVKNNDSLRVIQFKQPGNK